MTIHVSRGKVIEMPRNRRKGLLGKGMSKGMGVIFKHWLKSWTDTFHTRLSDANDQYYLTEADMSKVAGNFTVEYPEARIKLPEAYRNMPILLYDDETGHELCTSCFQCQRICPPQVIHMTQAKDPSTGKSVPAVVEFIIEYDACMSCGFCAEVCPFDAIKMDHVFELSTADHPSMTVHKEALLYPVSYYESIAPTFWAEVKESAYKKLGGNMKRRVGVIGIAPQMVEHIKATRPDLIKEPPPPPAAKAKPAPATDGEEKPMTKEEKLAAIRAKKRAAQEGGAEAPAAEEKPMTKEEKLAAIRAKKRAAKAEEESAAEAPAPVVEEKPMTKEERLAAIRAKKRAAKAEEESTTEAEAAPPEPATAQAGDGNGNESGAPAAVSSTDGESTPAATGQSMPDDKKARLEAIRAAKRKAKEESQE